MSALSEKVVILSKPYLGVAAEFFLKQQCKSHLRCDLSNLAQAHLRDLASCVERNGAQVMDPAKAVALAKKISDA